MSVELTRASFYLKHSEEYWKSLVVVEESENKKINESNSAINSDKGQNTVYLHSLMFTYNQRYF